MLEASTIRAVRSALAQAPELPVGSPPSTYAAYAAVTGEPGGWVRAIGTMFLRSAIIGTGLYVAGQRNRVMRSALYGSAAVEVAVLLHAWGVAQKNGH